MTDRIEDGGPAFPLAVTADSTALHGMTLRDYFAGQALAALILANDGDISTLRLGNAKDAYQAADAMLEARKQ